jgi:hypothetical protein
MALAIGQRHAKIGAFERPGQRHARPPADKSLPPISLSAVARLAGL